MLLRSSAYELAQLVKEGIELSTLLLELAVDLADAVGPWIVRQAIDALQQPILWVQLPMLALDNFDIPWAIYCLIIGARDRFLPVFRGGPLPPSLR